jgi:cold shock CspA family protein
MMNNRNNNEVKVVEGYLYVYPYAGDDVFVHPKKIDTKNFEELSKIHQEVWLKRRGISLMDVLEDLEGKKVKVVVEHNKILIEVLE